MTSTTPAATVVQATPTHDSEQSASYTFLTAILNKDVVTLRKFGVDDKTAASIDIRTQIDVAHKLLASDNNAKRSQSKRVLAQQAGIITKQDEPSTPSATVTPVTAPKMATFYRSTKEAQAAA